MRWIVDRPDCTDQIHVAGEDSEQDVKIHDKVQRCGKNAAGWMKRMTYTVLSHVKEQYKAHQGKASTKLKQIKDRNGSRKVERSKAKREE